MKNKNHILKIVLLSLFCVLIYMPTCLGNFGGNYLFNECNDINKTYIVDDDGNADYTSIQDAIDAANNGDMIYVRNGFYHETISINKSIYLFGEDKDNTIIDAIGKGCIIKVNTNDVSINNFTICNSEFHENGMEIKNSTFCTISDNIFYNISMDVIELRNSSNNLIKNNEIFGAHHYGIELLLFSNNNTISGNTITSGGHGVNLFFYCDDNFISENILNNTSGSGIVITGTCYRNNIDHNIITNNDEQGIYLWNAGYSTISQNIIKNNGGMGIHFYYGCHRNTIAKNIITNNNNQGYNGIGGIGIGNSNYNIIKENHIKNNGAEEIYLFECKYNEITENNIVDDFKGSWGSVAFVEYEAYDRLEQVLNDYLISFTNHFHKNYWGSWKILPKPIRGKIEFTHHRWMKNEFPAVIFDWQPVLKQYDIGL